MVEIEGTVESVIFRNEENGYTVIKLRYDNDLISVVGTMPYISENIRIKVQGEWVVHPTFGQQIKLTTYEEIKPNTIEGIEKYLASGLIPGIGPVTAKRIVEKFGKDTLDIMEMNPERLTEVEGIGEKKAQRIAESFVEQRELRSVLIFLQSYGITTNLGIKIYKRYGNETVKVVKENPYRLSDEISGIGFKTADKIARNIGVDLTSVYRIRSGIKYVLASCISNGHVYLPKLELLDECSKLLNIPSELIENQLASLEESKDIRYDKINGSDAYYLSSYYNAETKVARKIIELSLQTVEEDEEWITNEIAEFEKESCIKLADEQIDAVKEALINGVCVITGGPGTGKTTIIKCIIRLFKKKGMEVALCAPTGRAAKRITEATGEEAKTLHRLLEMEFLESDDGPIFSRDEKNPLDEDVIIVDEASMVDILLMNSLLKAITIGKRLIIVGDVDQLPSVGPGNVLRDIIDSKGIKVKRLNRVFRQKNESLIAINAHKINSGEMPYLNEKDKDFFFISKSNPQDILEEILNLVDRRLPSFKEGFDPLRDIQVLSPMRKGENGIINLNKELQRILNPPSSTKEEKEVRDIIFREGDKVMQTKNNYNIEWTSLVSLEGEGQGIGVFNGDIGFIEKIDNEEQKATVIFDDEKRVTYDFTSLDELDLAYAITIHKSQGSEFPVIVVPVSFGPPMLMTRNLIYTAVTRAKKLVVLVGMKQALQFMIENEKIADRYSGLNERIVKIITELK
ncbi:ATP-dependent RecD-like DNA helicase [Caloramator mitchellensis]|uniref:ATP-dependent RecD2 DNA helicase n=1 Tax=Caloramator mitchellensis TaxID=908809 RepID=A0A0R3JVX2_CALMK|nr:ATP-dependent RecD-like DNA helicase [Caloramator mitchellensis]KRQ87718.1 ATP-dependent RecD-like DNA helicase [Caloramator mitchellensis]